MIFLHDILQQYRANVSPGPHRFDNVKATVVKGTYYYNNPNFITVHAICLIGVAFSHKMYKSTALFKRYMLFHSGLTFARERKFFYFICNKYCLSTYYVLDSILRILRVMVAIILTTG